MLEARQLCVDYGKKSLLKRLSLAVHPGEVLVIVGPNGAGKSTLLKTLCGDLNPSSGFVQLNGRPLKAWPATGQAKIRGMLSQHLELSFSFSVSDVVLIGRSPHHRTSSRDKDRDIAAQAMQLTDTEHLADRMYTTLSGGEKQRVQLARVLTQIWESVDEQARYLLLDEPTSALDLSHQHSVLAIARHFAESQGAGVLAILHDLNLAALYADRIAILHEGLLVDIDTPEKILNAECIERVFRYPVMIAKHPTRQDKPLVISDAMRIARSEAVD